MYEIERLKSFGKLRFGNLGLESVLSYKPRRMRHREMCAHLFRKNGAHCTRTHTYIDTKKRRNAPCVRVCMCIAFSFSTSRDTIHCIHTKIIICEWNKIMITWFGKSFWDGLIIFFFSTHFSFSGTRISFSLSLLLTHTIHPFFNSCSIHYLDIQKVSACRRITLTFTRVQRIIMTINLICGYNTYNLVWHSIFGVLQLERTFG